MDITAFNSESSLTSTIGASLANTMSGMDFGSKLSRNKANTLRDRIHTRVNQSREHIGHISNFLLECDDDLKLVHSMRKEITIDVTSRIEE
jgi:hypothetical protein